MNKFHKAVSMILQPLIMPTLGMCLLLQMDIFSNISLRYKLICVIGTFLFTVLLPVFPIWYLIKRGEIKDLFISNRKERTIPYLFTIVAYCFWNFFLWKIVRMPFFIVSMSIATTISILLILLINFRWKISAHMAGIGGLVGSIYTVCYILKLNPVGFILSMFFLSALVAYSRIELKAHTPKQTLAGFCLGFVLVFATAFL